MNILIHPIPAEEQSKLKRFLRSDEMKKLIEQASGKEAEAQARAAEVAVDANSKTKARELPASFWLHVQEAEKWANFKKALEEMTHESYTFGKFEITIK